MKKIALLCTAVAIVLTFILCLSGCSGDSDGGKEAKSVDLAAVMQDIAANAKMPAETIDLATTDDLLDYYGIKAQDVKSFAVRMNASGYQDELIMIEATSADAAQTIKSLLDEKLENDAQEMRDYLPSQYEIILNSSVNVNGNYVSMFVSEDSAKMIEIYNSYFE